MMRSHTCGSLKREDDGQNVTLAGWVHTRRDHGNLIFIDLRDRWGVVQLVFNPEAQPELHRQAEQLRSEFVVQVQGKVRRRPTGTENPKIPTGEVEVLVEKLVILNESPPPPFEVTNAAEVSEELRLRYRFLDLRREEMQKTLRLRDEVTRTVRGYLHGQNFVEVETPALTRSTPEGARDFLVPSRLSCGNFYALPQSPQLFKQLLMVAGFDRYFQIARCFRDEDLRADRQPEHTQIDLEMSFVEEEDVLTVVEGMLAQIFEEALKKKIALPFRRIPYPEALSRYGTDKPDLRFEMPLEDVTEELQGVEFKIFKEAIERGERVKGLALPAKGAQLSRKDFDDLTRYAQDLGAKGLAWFKVKGGQELESPIAKFFSPERAAKILQKFKAKSDDALFLVADQDLQAAMMLGDLRLHLAKRFLSFPKDQFELCWVTDFPLFEWSEEEKRYVSLHHPFTAPRPQDVGLLGGSPEKVRARAYDLVLNGTEIGGGSIRIHARDIQEKVFSALKISRPESEEKFGFLLKALSFGAPPHGGIALGLDRIVALLCGKDSIREVIAFPKTQKGTCLMTEAPSAVNPRQLKELGIKVV